MVVVRTTLRVFGLLPSAAFRHRGRHVGWGVLPASLFAALRRRGRAGGRMLRSLSPFTKAICLCLTTACPSSYPPLLLVMDQRQLPEWQWLTEIMHSIEPKNKQTHFFLSLLLYYEPTVQHHADGNELCDD